MAGASRRGEERTHGSSQRTTPPVLPRTLRHLGVPVLLALVALSLASAADPYSFEALRAPLDLGDPAPPLVVDTWFQGTALTSFEPGRIYVIEFWATWCEPCVEAIPELEALQAAHPNKVTVVMLNVMESNHDTIRAWLAEHPVELTVGHGGATAGSPAEAWFNASRSDGVPTSFVVAPDGSIAAITHGLDADRLAEQLLAGTWSLAEAQAERANNLSREKFVQPLRSAVHKASTDEERLALYDAFITEHPPLEHFVAESRLGLLVKLDPAAAAPYAARWVDGAWNDVPHQLLNAAWKLAVTGEKWPGRGLPGASVVARRAASRAVELTERKNAGFLETLALTLWQDGATAEAVAVQAEAIALAQDPEEKRGMEQRLRSYRRRTPR